jgi:outer membrane protein assembly factor BamA
VSLDKGDRLYDFQHEIVFGAQMPAAARRAARKPPEVAEVRVVGAGADESALRSRLKLEPGDRFDFFRWQDDRDRLEAFYQSRDRLEARVTTRRLPAGASADATTTVQLVYDVRPGAHTTFIVDGFSLPDATIAAMKAAWTRAVVDEFLTEEVAAVARGELADRGFVLASVAAALDQPSPDEKRLRITIDRGPFARDRRVVFRGNQHVPDDRLRTLIQDRDMARAVWLDPDRVRDAVVAFYRREGYLRASVRIGPIQTASGTVARSIDVEEGEPFRVRELRVTGVRAFPPDELQKVSGLARGEPYSEAGIDRARSAIDQSYRTRGFNSAGVTIHAEAVADRPQVDVSVRVEEGPQQRLRDIVTTGAVRTRPALVSRALGLEVGEAVNLAEWLRARRRLYETGVFRRVDIESEPMARDAVPIAPDVSAEQPIRARVTVEEWPPLQLRYGLEVNDRPAESAAQRLVAPEPASGAGRSFGLGLAGDIGVRNLGGRAVSAGLTGRYTRDFRAARAYATAPSMFGLPITSNVFVSRSREQLGESGAIRRFVTDKTDVTLEQRVRPFDKTEVAYSYTFERNHTFDLNADPTDPFAFDVAVKVARLASTAIIDTRNDLVDATRGWFHASDLEYGPSSLGSDLHFMKYLLQQRYYRTIGPLVVATSARVGLATAFEQLLLPSERFFAGGGNSVRGYAEDVLGPHDSFGDAVGGKALVVLNEEVRFPIGKIVRGVGFLDAGRAFDGVTHIRLGDLSMGTGFGLRVQTPVALLRIDLGVPFDAAFGPRRVRWFFSIGQMF